MTDGPIIIGYDGSPAAEAALEATGRLFPGATALVVVVWESSHVWDALALASISPAAIDVRTSMDVDHAVYEDAQRLAQQGSDRARAAGLDADGLAVADEVSVAETLSRVAREHGARAVAIGSHGHRALHDALLGSTTQALIRHAACPVLVTRTPSS